MPAVALPLSFNNSFWTQDYRRGLETIYDKLEQGLAEDDEVIEFMRARIVAERNIAGTLTNPGLTGPPGRGFGADDGASLLVAFRGLQQESIKQGEAHRAIANDLGNLVLEPFSTWSEAHKDRVLKSRDVVIEQWLRGYEQASGEVAKLKHHYFTKTRRADEAEDDAKFAPNVGLSDKYTTALRPSQSNNGQRRQASVSERITEKLNALRKKPEGEDILERSKSPDADDRRTHSPEPLEKETVKLDKGKGKEVVPPENPLPPVPPAKIEIRIPESPEPEEEPSPISISGLSFPPSAVIDLLARAREDLRLRPVRFPIIGEYQDCFTGEEFTIWLKESLQGLGGSFARAEDAARDLTETYGALRRVGELGNRFESTTDAWYQLRPKVLEPKRRDSFFATTEALSPTLAPAADSLLQRSRSILSTVQKAVASTTSSEPPHIRARAEAEAAERTYQIAVRRLDRQRLGLEERIEETLRRLQSWEADRLRAVKSVLLQYQGTLANLPSSLQPPLERSSILIASYQPEQDLTALIERYRTGPFRPSPQVFESVEHEIDVVFGIDLRLWAGESGWGAILSHEGEKEKQAVPPVVSSLLSGIKEGYARLPDDDQRRKVWIYEVPLPAVHHLRETINSLPRDQPLTSEFMKAYDVPVLASTLKLWLLELNPSLGLWEGWDDFRRLYPNIGASTDVETADPQHIEALQHALVKLPKVHLNVLDALLLHWKELIDTTQTEESKEVFTTKLALSVARTILRPKLETEITIQDRHPTLFFIDLIKYYTELMPPVLARKKRESDRPMPVRKRTRPVDVRMSRSRLSQGGQDLRKAMEAQMTARGISPSHVGSLPSPPPIQQVLDPIPPVPPLPAVPAHEAAKPPPAETPKTVEEPPKAVEEPPKPVEEAPKPTVEVAPLESPKAPENEPPVFDDVATPRPNFKEPPPEEDVPRPLFAEPPPEPADDHFAPPAGMVISPPTPKAPEVSPPRQEHIPPVPSVAAARTPSPPEAVTTDTEERRSGFGLKRTGSNETSKVRGPRLARAPRAAPTSSTSTASAGRSSPAPGSKERPLSRTFANPDFTPRNKLVGRTAAGFFSRRTQASDAEDDVLGK
ncbi:hypothetical protein SISNIDRAFT_42434 [Sistotremastrum niveocremeum HHB9708]|uniref:Rho-GAP domain-containing protein n=1 Tax=Sistotremastrum niveocremeum HHB9708 TaxID=1314777 RepID=A0A164VSE6_9AGAM|nr:hypothetical protein SISNIDRAFT_42434 [Sistotremastrum niveocremeum HHB9708]